MGIQYLVDFRDNKEAVFNSEYAREVCADIVIDFLESNIMFLREPAGVGQPSVENIQLNREPNIGPTIQPIRFGCKIMPFVLICHHIEHMKSTIIYNVPQYHFFCYTDVTDITAELMYLAEMVDGSTKFISSSNARKWPNLIIDFLESQLHFE